jgi:hypothetical protein
VDFTCSVIQENMPMNHGANEWPVMKMETLDYVFHQSSVRVLSTLIIGSCVQYAFIETPLCPK